MDQRKWKDPKTWEAALHVALLDALTNYLKIEKNKIHDELPGNMAKLATPTRLDAMGVVVTLDAQLRTLDGTFALATS